MKKIIYFILVLIILNNCSGYKPIFISTNLQFEIADFSITGDKMLGNKIYSKLLRISNSKKNNQNVRSIKLLITVTKDKKAGAKDSTGKILNYKIILNTKVKVTDFLTDEKILDQTFVSSLTYKVQDQHSDTIELESRSIDDLVEKTYGELLIKLSHDIAIK